MNPQLPMPEWQGILADSGIANLSFQDSVLDTQPANSRAGLYVYLSGTLHGKPSFDDTKVVTLLHARYNEDTPTLISDLILASFDVLANAINRGESTRARTMIRSFIVNKLPLFLQTNYAGLIFGPLSSEICIRQALGRIDPLAAQSFDILSETRQDFLFACALHELIPESSIEDILGDVPMQNLPARGRYSKDALMNQFLADLSKIDQYVGELENMEGNSGAIASAIIETMHSLCASNDTMTLKGICNTLSRKPTALDILMLFTLSDSLLRPFCQILENWPDHEDQGEYQPVYDEFGSMLLFVTATKDRFNLKLEELGVEDGDSFLPKYLRSSSTSRTIDNLSSHESELLGSWIKGLFVTEGISDELMSACKPSEFHLLIATLFDQSLKACQAKMLTMETLKGGLEYLLEPFLLPSLVSGLNWFADQFWALSTSSPTIDVIMQALHALLKPARLSNESSLIHSAVLYIVAARLETSLLHVQKQFPTRSDIKPLLNLLPPFSNSSDGKAAVRDVTQWALTPRGGLLAALRSSLQALVLWSATAAATAEISAPPYSFEQIRSSLQILGAYKVVDVFIDEIQNANLTDIALDIVAFMLLAVRHKKPSEDQTNGQSMLNLPMTAQAVLRLKFDDTSELSKTDPARANVIVRLHRRVETLSGQTAVPSTANPAFMEGVTSNAQAVSGNEIDDVLAEAEVQTAVAQDLLNAQNNPLMGMT